MVEALVPVGALVLLAAVLTLALLVVATLRQSGRLLQRVEALERGVSALRPEAAGERQVAAESRLMLLEARLERLVARAPELGLPNLGRDAPARAEADELGRAPEQPVAPAAVAVQEPPPGPFEPGRPVPPMLLPDLDGRQVDLAGFRGKRALLLMWSPACGFCDMITPDLAEHLPRLRQRKMEVLLLAQGDREANLRLLLMRGLQLPVLLIEAARPPQPGLTSYPTPTAFLVDEQGVVVRGPEVGANRVKTLLAELIGALTNGVAHAEPSGKRGEGEGLAPGTPAPVFRLRDLDGSVRSLDEYRGQQVVVVFSDPQCGPCRYLVPELQKIHAARDGSGPRLIMVSRGSREENRRTARELGPTFPIVLQERWKTSKEYNVFATPAAFLIDEQGVVAREVAVGEAAILKLLES